MKGLGLRTTYFVEMYDPTETEVKTLGQQTPVPQAVFHTATAKTSEQPCTCSKSTRTVTSNIQTGTRSLWSAPTYSTHIGPAMCDNLPIAS